MEESHRILTVMWEYLNPMVYLVVMTTLQI